MRVGEQEADSTVTNALSMALMFSLGSDDAVREVRTVGAASWAAGKEHFKSLWW